MNKIKPLLLLVSLLLIACQALSAPFIAEPTGAPLPVVPPAQPTAYPPDLPTQPQPTNAPLQPPAATATASRPGPTPHPQIEAIIHQIRPEGLYDLVASLSGEQAVQVGGSTAWIESRNQDSEHLDTALQYAGEFMQALGLSVTYQDWYNDYEEVSGRNVIGELPGTTRPDEIVVISAHLDNMPERGSAPGADDNASGSAAVLTAAQHLAGYDFERTLRFVLLTGEEYCLCGSAAYADLLDQQEANVVTIYNMDMIAWDGNNDGHVYIFTRDADDYGYSADLNVYRLFTQVVDTYTLERRLVPHLAATSDELIDSWSFWEYGFSSVTALEDYDYLELNPYNHTRNDTLDTLSLPYFTSIVQASVATVALLAGMLAP